MKVLVIGAAGKSGEALVNEALMAGHRVTAFVRGTSQYKKENVRVVAGDVLDAAAVDVAVAGQDAVIDALGGKTPWKVTTMETNATHNIVNAMRRNGVRRLLEGDLSIGYWNNQGVTEWDTCEAGESLMVQPNAPHTFFNKSERSCRVLSVSIYHHERMMKDAVHPDGKTDFLPAQLTQADFEKLTKSMETNQTFLVANHF